jgi:SAM-dependent methyltransferase
MSTTTQGAQQDVLSAVQNSDYFDANELYAQRVASLETYREIRRAIEPEIAGASHLLDVGNGGVFAYDTALAERIVGVDLFLSDAQLPPAENVVMRRGDALALDEADASFDCVLEVALFHHLIGTDVASTMSNIRLAVEEAHRVLEPGGRLIVMESCVSERAFAVEQRLFGALKLLARTPLIHHPATLQFPPTTIAGIIDGRFGNAQATPIPMGRWILQFGVPWPTMLTPARHYLFTATR